MLTAAAAAQAHSRRPAGPPTRPPTHPPSPPAPLPAVHRAQRGVIEPPLHRRLEVVKEQRVEQLLHADLADLHSAPSAAQRTRPSPLIAAAFYRCCIHSSCIHRRCIRRCRPCVADKPAVSRRLPPGPRLPAAPRTHLLIGEEPEAHGLHLRSGQTKTGALAQDIKGGAHAGDGSARWAAGGRLWRPNWAPPAPTETPSSPARPSPRPPGPWLSPWSAGWTSWSSACAHQLLPGCVATSQYVMNCCRVRQLHV